MDIMASWNRYYQWQEKISRQIGNNSLIGHNVFNKLKSAQ